MLLSLVEPVVSQGEIAGRIALAALLGGFIGLEREVSGQPAGLRTHITVCLGAALFGVVSVHGFDAFVQPRADSNYQVDVTRVASQVVVAVGFLGAGAILKEGVQIHGLTTAASIWVTSAVGLALGIGSYFAAAVTAGALLLSLVGLRGPRRWIRRRLAVSRDLVVVQLAKDADVGPVMAAVTSLEGVDVRSVSARRGDDGTVIEAYVRSVGGRDLPALFSPIASREDVTGVDVA